VGIWKDISNLGMSRKLSVLYTNPNDGIYINHHLIKKSFGLNSARSQDQIDKIIHIIYPMEKDIKDYENNSQVKQFQALCEKNNFLIKKYYLDELTSILLTDSPNNYSYSLSKERNFDGYRMICGLYLLHQYGGVLLGHTKIISKKFLTGNFNQIFLLNEIFGCYEGEANPNISIMGCTKNNSITRDLLNIKWSDPVCIKNMYFLIIFKNPQSWIYPREIVENIS